MLKSSLMFVVVMCLLVDTFKDPVLFNLTFNEQKFRVY